MVADAQHIADLVPEIVGVQAVRGLGLLEIVQFPVAAGQVEAVFIVVQPAFAHAADLAHVDHHADLHGNIKLICAAFQLLTHALPLPGVPVRHVGERGLAVQTFQRTNLCQAVFLVTASANE